MPEKRMWLFGIGKVFSTGPTVTLYGWIKGGKEDSRELHAYISPAEARAKAADLIKAAEEAERYEK